MDQNLITHAHALSSWRTVRLDLQQGITTILVVETDLALTPDDPEYDADAFNSLADTIREYLTKHNNVDSADVHHIPK